MRKLRTLSIIVPCFNEEAVIRSTHQQLVIIMEELIKKSKCASYEIIYVNDGSTDKTQEVLSSIFAEEKTVRVLQLRRNFGLQGALCAGLAVAQGDAMVTIDADLQDPPEKIEDMISFWEKGYDLVLGVREDRQADSFFKKFTAESFYKFVQFLGVDIVFNHGDFRLMGRGLVDELNSLMERNRFLRALVLSLDDHYATVAYKRQPRTQGETKFTFSKMLSFSLDGIFSFSFVPLRIISIIGVLFCLIALVGIFYLLYAKMFGCVLPGWTSTVMPLFVFSGIQLLSLGIISEYIGRLYVEIKRRPLYNVRQELKH